MQSSTCDGVSLVHAVDFIEHPNMVKQTLLFIYRLEENAEFDILKEFYSKFILSKWKILSFPTLSIFYYYNVLV